MRYFFPSQAPQKPPQQSQAQQQQTQQPAAQPATPPAATTTPAQSAVKARKPAPKAAAPATTREATSESETTIDNDVFKVVFTNRGAQVKSWVLKRYKDDQGKPLELLHPIAAPKFGYPLSLWTYDEAVRNKLSSALYLVKDNSTQNQRTLTFDYSDGQVKVHKALTFDLTPTPPKKQPAANLYVVKLETSVTQNDAPVQAFPAWPSGFGDQTVPPSYANSFAVYRYQDTTDRKQLKSVSSGATITTPMQWAGATDQYFAAIFLPDEPQNAAMVQLRNQITIPKNLDKPDPSQSVNVDVVGAAVGNKNGATTERLFVGPKALEVLDAIHATPIAGQAQGPDLEPVVDFGRIFGWLAKPLFIWLEWTHDHWAPNWGWAIVILTLIINVALFPLRYAGMKSALLQQKIAPEIESIKSRYKGIKLTDPRQRDMQLEIQQLQKREGINPLGGCLPTLIQMPFLFAFYSMLGSANELRNAHWLWVKDLSSSDPYHLLPVAIVITMFIMQRITPMAGMDAAQAKMMQTMMPLMIGLISWSLPAGLCVYWVAGNIIGWGQQYIMNNTPHAREVRAHLAKRAAKKR